jgi:hypothetical protein
VAVARAWERDCNIRSLAAALLLACGACTASASSPAMVVGDGLVLACRQPQPLALRCDYRITAAGQPLAASAAIGDLQLPDPAFAARTGAPGGVAVLLLVDTSDPARSLPIRKAQQHIARLLETAPAYLHFGLASFDSELSLLAPIGSEAAAINSAAHALEANGRTTELYRNVVDALKLLATATDEHKVLLVMSDGLAEDRAYFHADAVAAALEHRIAVHGIGYPRSVALSVALQSLRRLSDDTGGHFVAADQNFELPDGYFGSPFAAVHNVGALSLDLEGAAQSLPEGPQAMRISLETSAGPAQAVVPVALPVRAGAEPVVKVIEVEVPRVIEVERVVEVPARAPPAPAAAAPDPQPAGVPLWYWVAAIALLALALLVLLSVLLLQRRAVAPTRASTPRPPPALAGFACLTAADGETHTIATATYRIGRLADNDLVLRDPSVSRHHAEIRRQRDGHFQVLDLESMNGVLVNGQRVRESALAHGDTLEVGDVRMAFAAENAIDLVGEDTVMLSTEIPARPFPQTAGARR